MRIPPTNLAINAQVSRPRELHPKSLAEPYVTLLRHTAPIIQPIDRRTANGKTNHG